MRIVGLLSWYDENPEWLRAACLSALTLCDEVIALDGAYEGFGDGHPVSPPAQYAAIEDVCGKGTALGLRSRPWRNQMSKRSALFEIASLVTTEDDWYFVFDADDRVALIPADTRQQLEQTSCDVAVYHLVGGDRYHRGLFRALRGLHVEDAHYHYVATKNGHKVHLRGNEQAHQLEPFLTTHMKVQHLKQARSDARKAASDEYRRFVAEHGIEKTTPEEWSVPDLLPAA